MKILLKTKALLFVSLTMIGLVVWDGSARSSSASALPVIDSLMRTDIDKIALTSMGNTITLEQKNGEWTQIAPLTGLADTARINAMILNFRNPIAMDVLIETIARNVHK